MFGRGEETELAVGAGFQLGRPGTLVEMAGEEDADGAGPPGREGSVEAPVGVKNELLACRPRYKDITILIKHGDEPLLQSSLLSAFRSALSRSNASLFSLAPSLSPPPALSFLSSSPAIPFRRSPPEALGVVRRSEARPLRGEDVGGRPALRELGDFLE
jgi:hypothetical protein